ncbi:MAG: hypothetical protein ACFFB3_23745 [Candidatus Hodarchaeota archaeon]
MSKEKPDRAISSKNQKCNLLILLRSHFLILPRVTHTVPQCATLANCILDFLLIPMDARFLTQFINPPNVASLSILTEGSFLAANSSLI